MAKDKMTTCKSCGHEISAKGKVICPNCGRVNKKPIYKRAWFIILVVFVIFGAIGGIGSNDEPTATISNNEQAVASSAEKVKEPMLVTVNKLMEDLESNPLKASDLYKGQYVEVTGKLSVIDSSGEYFSLFPSKDFAFVGVQCFIKEEHQKQVMQFEMGQNVTVIGTISDVGEILGYWLRVESIK